jgi:4'-phosphopantetheinyl transferase EntD
MQSHGLYDDESDRILLFPGISIARRKIFAGDEAYLTGDEARSLIGCTLSVRRAAAAARVVARGLLAEVGSPHWSMPRRVGRAPLWPEGVVGSLSHCDEDVAAAVSWKDLYAGIGIDIEPKEPLEQNILGLFASQRELQDVSGDLVRARILFCAKEAAYKAVYPLDGRFLEPHDISVNLESKVAMTCDGWIVDLRFVVDSRIIVLGTVRRHCQNLRL